MPHLVIATAATAVPMGAQHYQEEVAARAGVALRAADPQRGWRVSRTVVRSMRSPLDGNRRLPMALLAGRGERFRRAVARVTYPPGAFVHRMSLELPPAENEVVTLHDTVSWSFDDESPPIRTARAELSRAAAVVCVSEYTAGQAQDLLGLDRIVVIPNGVSPRFFDAAPLTTEEHLGLRLPQRYVLHMGGASKRKNLEALAEAWPSVAGAFPGVGLVLVGPAHPRRTRLFHGMPQVQMTGRVEDDLVAGLVASASVVVVPSLVEGFGLPALEAMAAGTPLVAAATSALPEVVGDGGILVPATAQDLAEGLEAALHGGADVASMVARGRARASEYTWERTAAAHARVWSELC